MAVALAGMVATGPGQVAFAQPAKKPTPAKPAAGAKPAVAPAASKPDPAKDAETKKARDAYASGEKKYKAGDYAGALPDFETADSVKPSPQAARYIGLCNDKLGKLPEAVQAYERFLGNVPDKLATEGEDARKRVAEIKATPGKLHVETTPPGAQVMIDGKPAPNVTPVDVDLPPGKHKLAFAAEGHEPAEREVDVIFASKQDVRVDLPSKPEPPPPVAAAVTPAAEPVTPPPPPPEPRSKVPAYVTGGLALAAAGVGTYFGVRALSTRSDFDKSPTVEKADDGENQALVADMAFGVALTLGVTSIVLFVSGDDASSAPKSDKAAQAPKPRAVTFTAAPYVTRGGGGAGALLRF